MHFDINSIFEKLEYRSFKNMFKKLLKE